MDLNVDNIINLLKKLSYSNKVEFAEQEGSADTSSSDTSTASSGTVKKWESGRTFGKTYMNDPKHKWYSGVQRGKANPAKES